MCSVTQCVVLQRVISVLYSACYHPAICVVLLSVLYYSVSRDPTDQRSPPSHLCSVTQCVVLQRVTQCVVLQHVERSH